MAGECLARQHPSLHPREPVVADTRKNPPSDRVETPAAVARKPHSEFCTTKRFCLRPVGFGTLHSTTYRSQQLLRFNTKAALRRRHLVTTTRCFSGNKHVTEAITGSRQ